MSFEFYDERKKTYLNQEDEDKPLKSPIPHETLVKARQYRLARIRQELLKNNCAAILLYDPVNIRYALVFAEGPAIMFEFKGCHHLCDGYEGVDEVRNSIAWLYMSAGDLAGQRLVEWSGEIDDFEYAYPGHYEKNMTLCIESLIGESGSECVKLETQVLVTEHGVERLESFPYETE